MSEWKRERESKAKVELERRGTDAGTERRNPGCNKQGRTEMTF